MSERRPPFRRDGAPDEILSAQQLLFELKIKEKGEEEEAKSSQTPST